MKKIAAFALVACALAACSSPEKQAQRVQQEILHSEPNLAAAQRDAVIDCTPANCDAAWAATKRYIEQHSDTHVIRADAIAIDTDVPDDSGKAAFSATRADKSTGGATLSLFAQCRGMYGPDSEKGSDYDECADKILKTQNGYVPYLRSHASAQ
ncbi:hypothetical protein BJG93_18280 [Paraburkholderia sprentiae WSM5005]|uniref:Lipoprotein n=1 Tax=Paraburkholderia sprentiae WSM5005 TaxID=754502 RepID=A0A1I9YMB7_9BURK|nr:hypothetical protein [Paraburkholderia sprentiae]APA87450.1 hypothetical protein BJG93_18280 [Paraburkholderia sprentiae WSM5005]